MRALGFFLLLLIPFIGADASTEIENAISPDKKLILTMKPEELRCRVLLKNKANGKVLTSFNVEGFFADNVRDTITADWRKDSAAVALNITLGRSISECEVIVLTKGQWKRLAWPEKELKAVRERNNEQDGKSQDYLTFAAWLPGGVQMSYQGNIGSVEDLECQIVLGAKPRLRIVKTMVEGEVEQEPKYDYEDYVFSVLAGGTQGSKDGAGRTAQFKSPHGLSLDAAGNVFVADRGNDLVRKIGRDGVVTTLAGSAEKFGNTDGAGEAARFRYPIATAVDASGNIYVADSSNNLIRKITPSGVVSTLAGASAGLGGYADGSGNVVQFQYPIGVAVDNKENVFVADSNNKVIRKITADGKVTTFAGSPGEDGMVDGEAKSARFHFPFDVALDRKGNLYVTDNSAVRKIDMHGTVSTLAGSLGEAGNTDGTGRAARFSHPISVAVSAAGSVYVADDGNKNIRKITPDGVVKTIRDSTGRTPFVRPVSVAADDKEQIYVADEDGFSVLVGRPAN
jgi:streptogramin lyase